MLIAIFVGAFSGLVGMLCWTLIQYLLNLPGVYSGLGANWAFLPAGLGIYAAIAHTVSRTPAFRRTSKASAKTQIHEKRLALPDLFESYYFGSFILHPLNWLARGSVSLLNAVLGGTFGLEGGILEISYASLPKLSRYIRLFAEERQIFVMSTISASLGVAFGAPFSGALAALELVHANEARVRTNAVVSALVAYGTATLLQSFWVSTGLLGNAFDRHSVLSSLFAGLRPASLDAVQWMWLSAAAVGVGLAAGMLAILNSRLLDRGSRFFNECFPRKFAVGMIAIGCLMTLTAWFIPESFSEPWRAWEDMAWQRLTSSGALVLLSAEWVLLLFAFSGWGSSGLFTPMLVFGALFGYACGNSVSSSWALPLAIAGAASWFSASYRVPIAASALVLEVGQDASIWWLATLAVLAGSILTRYFKFQPLQEILLGRYGLKIIGGRAANLLSSIRVDEVMSRDFTIVPEDADLEVLTKAAGTSLHAFLGVVSSNTSQDQKYIGLLALEQMPASLRRVLAHRSTPLESKAVERMLEIRKLMDSQHPTLLPGDNLQTALSLLQDAPCIAVLDEQGKLCGLVFESAIAGRYTREMSLAVLRKS